MGKVLAFKRPAAKDRRKGITLCRNNHHKWKLVKEKKFDVREGKLVTVFECVRCGVTKHKLL